MIPGDKRYFGSHSNQGRPGCRGQVEGPHLYVWVNFELLVSVPASVSSFLCSCG